MDAAERFVVSSMGWVDRAGFVRRGIADRHLSAIVVPKSSWVRLFPVDRDRFMVAGHAPEDDLISLSIRRFDSPHQALWSLDISPVKQNQAGDPSFATAVRRYHLATFKNGGKWDHRLVCVKPDGRGAELGELPWYNAGAYDLGYQGLVDVVELPDTTNVLVSVQRSSTVIVHDPVRRCEVGRFDLAGRGGNAVLTIVGNELWTVDYDTFVRVDLESKRVANSVLVQPPEKSTTSFQGQMRQFAGDLFVGSNRAAVIPRPFSGDVVLLNPETCMIELTAKLGHQPLSCVMTSRGDLVARDWKTGDWIEGHI